MSLMSLMSLSHLSRAAWIFRSRHVGMSGCARQVVGRCPGAGGLKKAGEAAERCGRDEWFQYVPIGEIGSNVFVALGSL